MKDKLTSSVRNNIIPPMDKDEIDFIAKWSIQNGEYYGNTLL